MYSYFLIFQRHLLFRTLCFYVIYCNLCEAQCPSECNCISWKGKVSCEGVGLFEIPVEIPSDANVLLLGSNFIDSINEEYFQNMQDILEIDLQGNVVHEIPPNSFAYLTSLQVLNLRFNRITALPEEVFTGLTKLQRLDLRGNNIDRIAQNAFAPLFSLQFLDLYGNSLRNIPEGTFWRLRTLELLDLGKTMLRTISSANVFRGLSNLTTLRLGDNSELSKLPSRMSNELPALKVLVLQGCNLYPLSSEMFEGFAFLEELQLQNTGQQKTLPLGIFDNIPNLKTLRLDNNRLTSIHESVISPLEQTNGKLNLQKNKWQCSCGLLSIRAKWPLRAPKLLKMGISCQNPFAWQQRDLWSIPLYDLFAHCMRETRNVEVLHLPNDSRMELQLQCPISKFGFSSVLEWITPEGHYISQSTIYPNGRFVNDPRYQLFHNGTLLVNNADPGNFMCIVTNKAGKSETIVFKVTFSDGLFGEPLSPADSDHESNTSAVLLPTAIVVAIVIVITVIVAWLRCRHAKGADDKPFDSPLVPVKNMDHAYAYAYVSARDGNNKKKRDISAYAINALFVQLHENVYNDKPNSVYDHVKGQRPKSHSCRERGSKYPAPVPVPRPSHTLGSRATSRAESCIYVTPANNSDMEMLMPTRVGNSDPEMNIPVYGTTQMAEEERGYNRLRELQSKSVKETSGRNSNPYLELVV
ncbi:uncharacterized protein [Amphiura filiformis]|uniref:uncharacterized protein n=1 Tax=Amphiura filiformis TaxID=82378 RepID=UPI003B215C8A